MKCPKCGLLNPDEAQRCDCGYDFQTKTIQPSCLADLGGKNSLHRSAQARLSVVVAAGFLGLVSGAVAGFCLVSVVVGVVIGQLPSRPFGEMAGVAAIDFGMFLGVPLGAILVSSLSVYLAIRINRR